jgi:hypothetical protein
MAVEARRKHKNRYLSNSIETLKGIGQGMGWKALEDAKCEEVIWQQKLTSKYVQLTSDN